MATETINILTTGQQFGLLTVLDPEVPVYGSKPRKSRVTTGTSARSIPPRGPRRERGAIVECACGQVNTVLIKNLVRPAGGIKACRACAKNAPRTQDDILWQTHHNIGKRCYNPNDPHYDAYGGRGIGMAPQWRTYEIFRSDLLKALGERPEGYSLDRIDNNGDYEPGNVRWASNSTQRSNTRRSHRHSIYRAYIAEHFLENPAEVAKILGISPGHVSTIRSKLRQENPGLYPPYYRTYTVEALEELEARMPGAYRYQLAEAMGCSLAVITNLRKERDAR